MKNSLCSILLATSSFSAWGQDHPSSTLCLNEERTVFSCQAGSKTVSICATGDFSKNSGALSYRFGKYGQAPELIYTSTPATVKNRFRYEEDFWAKGMITSVKFDNGQFSYEVTHARGAFGVDGGPNRAGVTVLRGTTQLAEVACDEKHAVDRMYEELSATSLHVHP